MIESIDLPPAPAVSGCGAQSLAAVVAWHDPALESDAVVEAFPWREQASTPIHILLSARQIGYQASILPGTWEQLAGDIERQTPPLVMFDSTRRPLLPVWPFRKPAVYHWGVVSGVAKDGDAILIAAPGRRHHVLPRKDFIRRWDATDNCSILVTPNSLVSAQP